MTNTQKSNLKAQSSIGSNVLQMAGAYLTITNARFDLYPVSNKRYGLIVYSPSLANKINKILEYYPKDTKVTFEDEALFKFTSDRLPELSKLLRLKLGK